MKISVMVVALEIPKIRVKANKRAEICSRTFSARMIKKGHKVRSAIIYFGRVNTVREGGITPGRDAERQFEMKMIDDAGR